MQTNYASYLCKVFSFFLLLFFVWFRPFAFLMIVGVQCSANTTSHLNPCIIYVALAFCCRYPIELIIEWFSSISSMFFEDSALWVDSFCFHRWEHWTEKRSNVTSSRFFIAGCVWLGFTRDFAITMLLRLQQSKLLIIIFAWYLKIPVEQQKGPSNDESSYLQQ